MKSILLILPLAALFISGVAHSEALMVTQNEVTAATLVKKPAREMSDKRPSAPEENKEEVKSDS
jgi:hypothetical protein